STTAATDGAAPDPAIEIAERIRRFARGSLLPGRVVRVPVAGAPAGAPELAFYVEEGAKATSLAGLQGPTIDEIARQSDDHAEALVRANGLAGLRDGFRLTREMCSQYWDGLCPSAEAEGMEGRVAPLTGLNGDDSEGTLIGPIRQIQLTAAGSVGPFGLWQY